MPGYCNIDVLGPMAAAILQGSRSPSQYGRDAYQDDENSKAHQIHEADQVHEQEYSTLPQPTLLRFRQHFQSGDSVQRFILDAADDPDFSTLLEERLEYQDETTPDFEDLGPNRIICFQVETPSEWPVVRKIHAHRTKSLIPVAIREAFLLPWVPGWVFIVVRVNSEDDLRPVLQKITTFEGIGRHFHFVGGATELAPPETPAMFPDLSTYDWVKIRRGPYTNDWGLVISMHGVEKDDVMLDTPYPFARVVVVPRLCSFCHLREELGKGFDAWLCSFCCIDRPIAKLRRNLSDVEFCQRASADTWSGIDPVTGLAVICVPIKSLEACSYMPREEFGVFEKAQFSGSLDTGVEHHYEAFASAFTFPRPLFASQVMRKFQPVWIRDQIFIVVDVPADTAKNPLYTVIPYDNSIISSPSDHPVHVEIESQHSAPPLIALPYFTEGVYVRGRSGQRAGLIYEVTQANRQTLWLTLKLRGRDLLLWTKDWHNFEACSGNAVELEKKLANHIPPIYLKAPELPPAHHALGSQPWIGRQVEILFPPYSAAHRITHSIRKELGKHKYGQVTSLDCTQDVQQFPSGIKVTVGIYAAQQNLAKPAFDLYEVKDIESPIPRAFTPVPTDGDISWGIPPDSEYPHNERVMPTHHSSEETQPGFTALRHVSFLGKYLRVYVAHQGKEREAWGRVTRTEEHLRFVYRLRGRAGQGMGSPNEGLLNQVVQWLALDDRSLKSVAAVTVHKEGCQLLGERLVTVEEHKAGQGIRYIVCRERDVVEKQPDEVTLFSVSKSYLATEGDSVEASVKDRARGLRVVIIKQPENIQYVEEGTT
ncbi:hypothetical protein DL96DRAFT_1557529 [Flagelloscypha sp. PMI_526]|nr:hypothetical protein DL96DRAFT_1557529 [Flagelloscypha sp. PMI_526]